PRSGAYRLQGLPVRYDKSVTDQLGQHVDLESVRDQGRPGTLLRPQLASNSSARHWSAFISSVFSIWRFVNRIRRRPALREIWRTGEGVPPGYLSGDRWSHGHGGPSALEGD